MFHTLGAQHLDFLQPSASQGLTGQGTMDWMWFCHQKTYVNNLRCTKCTEMPAQGMSSTVANPTVPKACYLYSVVCHTPISVTSSSSPSPQPYFMFSCPVELLLIRQVTALFSWGHFCPLCSQGPRWRASLHTQSAPPWLVPVHLAAEARQGKQCPVISSQPCPSADAAGSRLECFVTQLCCSQLGCSNSPCPSQGGSLCCTPDAARNCLAQNDLLTCLNGALKALALHKMLPLASKDLN